MEEAFEQFASETSIEGKGVRNLLCRLYNIMEGVAAVVL